MTRRNDLTVPALLAVLLTCTTPSAGQVPEGMEVLVLAKDLGIHSRPDMNDQSEVVWSSSFPIEESDVWLFSGGIVQKISEPGSYDINPAINNNGVVAWMRCESWFAEACEVVTWENGVITHIPTPVTVDGSLDINDAGHIVFSHDFSESFAHVELFLYDGQTVEQITDNGLSNQSPRTNDAGAIAWVKADFSVSPWQSHIMLRSGESIVQLTQEEAQRGPVDLNDVEQVVWYEPGQEIVLWQAGETKVLTDDGRNARINNSGDVIFMRWNDATVRWDTWLHLDGEFLLVSDGVGSSAGGAINDTQNASWREIVNDFGDTGILILRRIGPKGDFDHDCHVDWFDFMIFQRCFAQDTQTPTGEPLAVCARADFDDDGDVDRDDFAAFENVYTGPEESLEKCEP